MYQYPYGLPSPKGGKEDVTMPGAIPERERYTPLVLTETESLTREQWLDYRRQGIGGSDVAAIIGI